MRHAGCGELSPGGEGGSSKAGGWPGHTPQARVSPPLRPRGGEGRSWEGREGVWSSHRFGDPHAPPLGRPPQGTEGHCGPRVSRCRVQDSRCPRSQQPQETSGAGQALHALGQHTELLEAASATASG